MSGFTLRLLGLLLAGLTACVGKAPDGGPGKVRTGYYFDANLGFAIEHPQDWQNRRAFDKEKNRVAWLAPAKGGRVGLTITCLAPAQAPGGFDSLLAIFRGDHPEFEPVSEEDLELPGAPARQVIGTTSEEDLLVVLVTSSRRAFILAFTAPRNRLKAWQPLFNDMLESFRVLD